MDDSVIKVEHLEAGYPGVTVLHDVNFSVRRGEVFALLGGSGCGKSTIMKHLIGLNPAPGGKITVAGLEMNRANRARILRKIGPADARRTLALMQLDLVGLREAAEKMPNDLSGGMKKRAAIARALVLEPEILFLDEPSAGLDPLTSSALDDLILRLRDARGVTFVVVTHELPSIFKIADRCAMFDRVRQAMVAFGRPAELRDGSSDPFVRQFFNRGGSNGS